MRTLVAAILLLASTLPLLAPSATAASPTFYETTLASDTADDFPSNGALDIVGIHVSEIYSWNGDRQEGTPVIQFRLELRNRDEIRNLQGQVPIDYTLNFTVANVARSINITMTHECPVDVPSPGGGGGVGPNCSKLDPVVPRPHFTNSTSVVFVLPAGTLFIPGRTIGHVYATSATIVQGVKTYQDQAPFDSGGQPMGSTLVTPETGGGPVTLRGPFPFLTLHPLTPTTRFMVSGGSATYSVEVRVDPRVGGVQKVLIDFQAPSGWGVETVLARQLTMSEGVRSVPYTFTIKSPAGIEEDVARSVLLDVVLPGPGGHATLALRAEVTGPRISLPGFTFDLLTPGPFNAGAESMLRFKILEAGKPLLPSDVRVDFAPEGAKSAQERRARSLGAGEYAVNHTFTQGGTWTVEPFIYELKPSPHRIFDVQVKDDGGGVPGPAWTLALAAVLGGLFISRVSRRERG